MQIFSWSTLRAYADSHAAARSGLERWHHLASKAAWTTPAEVRASDPAVSFVGDRLVFNIQGNAYRLVVRVDWQRQWLFVRFVGTHAEYDRIQVEEI